MQIEFGEKRAFFGLVEALKSEILEVVEHFLEKNDFHSFPEMPISEGNVFFLKSKSHLQNRQKMSQKSFQENHF